MREKKPGSTLKSIVWGILSIYLVAHIFFACLPEQALVDKWYSVDDAFYYFKVAQNIVEGKGITFDGLNLTNGYHPLWMILCIPVFWFSRINLYLPLRVLVLLQAVLTAIGGTVIFRFFAQKGSPGVGLFGLIFFLFTPAFHSLFAQHGLESSINGMMLVLLLFANFKFHNSPRLKDHILFGVIGALTIFARLDNVFLVFFMGLNFIFHQQKFRYAILMDSVFILIAAIFSYYFRMQGTPYLTAYIPLLNALTTFALIIYTSINILGGLYECPNQKPLRCLLKVVLCASFSGMITMFLLYVSYSAGFLPVFSRQIAFTFLGLTTIFLPTLRFFFYRLFSKRGERAQYDFKAWFTRAVRYFGPIGVSMAAYLLFNKMVIGSAFPVSGSIKRWWGTLPSTPYGKPITTLDQLFADLLSADPATGPLWPFLKPVQFVSEFFQGNGLAAIFVLVILAGIACRVFKNNKDLVKGTLSSIVELGLPAFGVGYLFQTLQYKAGGYLHSRSWYWIPAVMLAVFLFLIFFQLMLAWLKSWAMKFRPDVWIIVCGVALVFMNSLFNFVPRYMENAQNAGVDYHPGLTKILLEYTQPGDVIGMTGGGVEAYFLPNRTIVNLDGLINSPEYFQRLKNAELQPYFQKIGLQYVLAQEDIILHSDPYRWVFSGYLQTVVTTQTYNLFQYLQNQ